MRSKGDRKYQGNIALDLFKVNLKDFLPVRSVMMSIWSRRGMVKRITEKTQTWGREGGREDGREGGRTGGRGKTKRCMLFLQHCFNLNCTFVRLHSERYDCR